MAAHKACIQLLAISMLLIQLFQHGSFLSRHLTSMKRVVPSTGRTSSMDHSYDDDDDEGTMSRHMIGVTNKCHCFISSLSRRMVNSSQVPTDSCQQTHPSTFGNNATTTARKIVLPQLADIWESRLRPRFANYILQRIRTLYETENNKTFVDEKFPEIERDWRKTFQTFTLERLERSKVQPMRSEQRKEILKLIQHRLSHAMVHNNNASSSSSSPPPLRILVSGGSPIEGSDALGNYWGMNFQVFTRPDAAWPYFLELLLNDVVFGGRQVVSVTNAGSGGCTSDVGAEVVKYRLWPEDYPTEGPDIIIMAHTVNDVHSPPKDVRGGPKELMETFLRASASVRPCTNISSLPAVVMFDEYVGHRDDLRDLQLPFWASATYATTAQLAGWYQTSAVSYGNAFRHVLSSNDPLPSGEDPFYGTAMGVHPGMLYHSTAALVLIYNLLSDLLSTCSDERFDDLNPAVGNDQYKERNSIKAIPPLRDRDAASETTLATEWDENQRELDRKCDSMKEANFTNRRPCSFYWITNKQLGVKTTSEITEIMDPVLRKNEGWTIEGNPIRKPRPGWVAIAADAHFVMEVAASTMPIKLVTIMSMLSYGEKWEDSKVEVTLEVIKPDKFMRRGKATSFEVVGYHEQKTSVIIPHEFEVPSGGADVGETVRATFRLIGGTTFRIQGIFFCFSL